MGKRRKGEGSLDKCVMIRLEFGMYLRYIEWGLLDKSLDLLPS